MTDSTNEFQSDTLAELQNLLKEGAPLQNIEVEASTVTIYVDSTDTSEDKDAKKNIEFTLNSGRETISYLIELGKMTGNPRFFETVATILNVMNNANAQLLTINREKKNSPSGASSDGTGKTYIKNQNNTFMTAQQAMQELEEKRTKTINAEPNK